MSHQQQTYPKLSDVPDIEHDPAFPKGFESEPDANGCALLTGALSVLSFCLSNKWPNSTQRKVARAFASHGPSASVQWTKALEAFPDQSDDAKQAINAGTRAPRFLNVLSGALPAVNAGGTAIEGANALSETCTDPKADYFAMLLYDLQHGAIEGSPGAVA